MPSKIGPKDREIPRWALKDGATVCRAAAARNAAAAEVLLNADHPGSAAVFVSLAMEELGKAAMLRDAFDTGGVRDHTHVISGFTDHNAKLAAAARLTGGSPLRFSVRVDRLYVDWQSRRPSNRSMIVQPHHEGRWVWNETPVDPLEVRDAIHSVNAALGRAAAEWSSWRL